MASFAGLTRGLRQQRNPQSGDQTVAAALTSEVARAQASEAVLAGAVTSETSRAQTAEALAARKASNLSDLASAAAARANLALIPIQAAPPTGVAATDTASLTAAINALNATAGAEVALPSGTYQVNAALPQITSPVNLHGSVSGIVPASKAGTVISYTAGVPGLSLSAAAQFSRIASLYLKSASSSLGTDDGISSLAHGLAVEQVVCDGFGRDAISIDTSVSGNANNSLLRAVRAINSQRHGFYVAGSNSNVITLGGGCDATGNAGWGFYLNGAAVCLLLAPHAALNTLGAYKDTGNSNIYLAPYSEAGVGNSADLSGGSNLVWIGGSFGQPPITAGAGNGNTVLSAHQWLNQISGMDPATGHKWQFTFGSYSAGYLALADLTNSVNILDVDANDTRIETLIPMLLSGGVNGTTGTTAPAAGGAGALPATPTGYLTVKINGTNRQVPYY